MAGAEERPSTASLSWRTGSSSPAPARRHCRTAMLAASGSSSACGERDARSVLVGFADALAAPEVAASLLEAGHRVSGSFTRRGRDGRPAQAARGRARRGDRAGGRSGGMREQEVGALAGAHDADDAARRSGAARVQPRPAPRRDARRPARRAVRAWRSISALAAEAARRRPPGWSGRDVAGGVGGGGRARARRRRARRAAGWTPPRMDAAGGAEAGARRRRARRAGCDA